VENVDTGEEAPPKVSSFIIHKENYFLTENLETLCEIQ
jgi:hypothetical protein